jgi:arabinan endo-1,5-alpha-L-arabinosidase
MNFTRSGRFAVLGLLVAWIPTAWGLEGDLRMHDPSTVIFCQGRYWVYSTGRGISVHSSADRYTWRAEPHVFTAIPAAVHAAVPKNNGLDAWAPDIAFLNGEYYLYYAVSSWGSEVSAIALATSPTLDPTAPNYRWTDRGVVTQSKAGERMNDIDPCIFKAPDGSLWLTYGSYIGTVDLLQLDPGTGLRLSGGEPQRALSSASEASALIFHGGYYYLLINRGSCCKGPQSTYNIRMGRSRTVAGPYLDRHGEDMLHGGGSLFLGSGGGMIGPGHFGLLSEEGVDRFSVHFEADRAHNNRPVLDIRPLLWDADGWPRAGADAVGGTYQILNASTGKALEAVPAEAGAGSVRQTYYSATVNEQWKITALGAGKYSIAALDGAALQAPESPASPLLAGPATGTPRDTWVIEQVADGSYRIENQADRRALTASGALGREGAAVGLAPYADLDRQKWLLEVP